MRKPLDSDMLLLLQVVRDKMLELGIQNAEYLTEEEMFKTLKARTRKAKANYIFNKQKNCNHEFKKKFDVGQNIKYKHCTKCDIIITNGYESTPFGDLDREVVVNDEFVYLRNFNND